MTMHGDIGIHELVWFLDDTVFHSISLFLPFIFGCFFL
jgi:hypothetical protein